MITGTVFLAHICNFKWKITELINRPIFFCSLYEEPLNRTFEGDTTLDRHRDRVLKMSYQGRWPYQTGPIILLIFGKRNENRSLAYLDMVISSQATVVPLICQLNDRRALSWSSKYPIHSSLQGVLLAHCEPVFIVLGLVFGIAFILKPLQFYRGVR